MTLQVSEFLRVHDVRAPNVMWLLGAGASAASGVATASQLIWEFKRRLYCAEQNVPVALLPNLTDPLARARLDHYFAGDKRFPASGSEDEYGALFEATYPDEADRRRFIQRIVESVGPSHGHLALAVLFALEKVHVIWTTNFDRLVEDAAAQVLGTTSALTVATLDTSDLALQGLNEGRWPLLVKLHGDFQSRRLKNTSAELQEQDARLRDALSQSCQRYGLAVVGYSGRDASIMASLEAALQETSPFPQGIFWFHRSAEPPFPAVTRFLDHALAAGVDAHLLEVETFDELLGSLLLLADVPDGLQAHVDQARPPARLSPFVVPGTVGAWPVLRLNALQVKEFPSTCRLVRCDIGGAKDVRNAVENAGADVIATRRHDGVVGFGRDQEMRRAFESFGIEAIDVAPIDPRRLQRERSADLSLLYEALMHAGQRERPVLRRGRRILAVDPAAEKDPVLEPVQAVTGRLTGMVSGTDRVWSEAIRIRVEYRFGFLWLLLEPTVWVERAEDAPNEDLREFARERVATRYNQKWSALLEAWAHVITGGQAQAELRTFGVGDGVDALFRIGRKSAYSMREER